MRLLNKDEQILYETLKEIDGSISSDDLAEHLGWSKQKFLDVSCPVARDFRDYNLEHAWDLSVMLVSKDVEVKTDYFMQSLVNCALLVESKIIELNTREEFNDPKHQIFIKQWEKYRGY